MKEGGGVNFARTLGGRGESASEGGRVGGSPERITREPRPKRGPHTGEGREKGQENVTRIKVEPGGKKKLLERRAIFAYKSSEKHGYLNPMNRDSESWFVKTRTRGPLWGLELEGARGERGERVEGRTKEGYPSSPPRRRREKETSPRPQGEGKRHRAKLGKKLRTRSSEGGIGREIQMVLRHALSGKARCSGLQEA